MITEILTHTPIWVFLLFALLLAGIHSSFGLLPLPIAAWGVALMATAGIGYLLFRVKRIAYDQPTQKFVIPGSWTPFSVILAIFLTKYVFAVMRALNETIIGEPAFIGALCVAYGIFCGYFASRAINLIARARRDYLRR